MQNYPIYDTVKHPNILAASQAGRQTAKGSFRKTSILKVLKVGLMG